MFSPVTENKHTNKQKNKKLTNKKPVDFTEGKRDREVKSDEMMDAEVIWKE